MKKILQIALFCIAFCITSCGVAYAQAPNKITARCPTPSNTFYATVLANNLGNITYTPCPTGSSLFYGNVDFSNATVSGLPSGGGNISGSGTVNRIPRFVTNTTTIGNSPLIWDNTKWTMSNTAETAEFDFQLTPSSGSGILGLGDCVTTVLTCIKLTQSNGTIVTGNASNGLAGTWDFVTGSRSYTISLPSNPTLFQVSGTNAITMEPATLAINSNSTFTGLVDFSGATVTGLPGGGTVTGTGTANNFARWTSGSAIGNIPATWNGTNYVFSNTAGTAQFNLALTPSDTVGTLGLGDCVTTISTCIQLDQTASTIVTGNTGGSLASTWNTSGLGSYNISLPSNPNILDITGSTGGVAFAPTTFSVDSNSTFSGQVDFLAGTTVDFTGATVTGLAGGGTVTGTGTTNNFSRWTSASAIGDIPATWDGTKYIFSDTPASAQFNLDLTPSSTVGVLNLGDCVTTPTVCLTLTQSTGTTALGGTAFNINPTNITYGASTTTNHLSGSVTDFNAGSTVDFTGATVTGLAGGGTVTGTGTTNNFARWTSSTAIGDIPATWNGTKYVFSDTAGTAQFNLDLTPSAAAGLISIGDCVTSPTSCITMTQSTATTAIGGSALNINTTTNTFGAGTTNNFVSGSVTDFNAGSTVDFTGATVTGLPSSGITGSGTAGRVTSWATSSTVTDTPLTWNGTQWTFQNTGYNATYGLNVAPSSAGAGYVQIGDCSGVTQGCISAVEGTGLISLGDTGGNNINISTAGFNFSNFSTNIIFGNSIGNITLGLTASDTSFEISQSTNTFTFNQVSGAGIVDLVDINNFKVQQTTDTSGAGVTINKPFGMVRINGGGSTLVITNSLVTTSSLIFCTLQSNGGTDATAKSCSVNKGAGTMVVALNAAATGNVDVAFWVVNP